MGTLPEPGTGRRYELARILIIDDEEGVRIPLRAALQMAGHQVEEAADGQDGVNLFLREPADLVITDMRMPGKDGLETLQELLQQAPDLKIVAIAADETTFSQIEALGIQNTFAKPFRLQELVEAVQKLLEG